MQYQVMHFVIHTPDQAREIIAEAERIAAETEYEGREREIVFKEACRLLGMRVSVPVQPQAPVPMDLSRLLREGNG